MLLLLLPRESSPSSRSSAGRSSAAAASSLDTRLRQGLAPPNFTARSEATHSHGQPCFPCCGTSTSPSCSRAVASDPRIRRDAGGAPGGPRPHDPFPLVRQGHAERLPRPRAPAAVPGGDRRDLPARHPHGRLPGDRRNPAALRGGPARGRGPRHHPAGTDLRLASATADQFPGRRRTGRPYARGSHSHRPRDRDPLRRDPRGASGGPRRGHHRFAS